MYYKHPTIEKEEGEEQRPQEKSVGKMEKHGLLEPNHATDNATGKNSGDSCINTSNSEDKLLNKRRKSEERKLKAVLEKLENGKVY